jgi:hypothetical protein
MKARREVLEEVLEEVREKENWCRVGNGFIVPPQNR